MSGNTNEFYNFKLDRNLPIPLYYQIEKFISDKIKKGDLKPGEKLPTEIELMNLLKVSRITIRKAAENLLRNNLIEIKKGQGTFIKSKQFYEPVFGIRSYTEEALKQGFLPSTKILEIKIIQPSEEILKNLKLNKDDKIYSIIRLRYLNGEPTGVDYTFIPVNYTPGLSKDDFEEYGKKQSLYNLLESKYNLILDEAEEIITATLTKKYEAELLGLKSKSPINLRKRVVYLPNKSPLLYMKAIYKTSYKTTLKGRPR